MQAWAMYEAVGGVDVPDGATGTETCGGRLALEKFCMEGVGVERRDGSRRAAKIQLLATPMRRVRVTEGPDVMKCLTWEQRMLRMVFAAAALLASVWDKKMPPPSAETNA